MKNISFDNPYLLLLIIPLLAFIIVPYIIAIRKDNRSKSVIASLVIHIVISLLVTLGIAGTVITQVMTETQVIVVADISYSANRNLDLVDSYIQNVQKALPDNSKMGVVCFGKDYKVHTEIGGELSTVKNSVDDIDDSATNIADALDYAKTLFDDNVIKRIVLISDGKQTDNDSGRKLISTIEEIYAEKIYIDAIYLDDNIDEKTNEIQISSVESTKSTYLNHESTADVLIQSNTQVNGMVSLYRKSEGGEYEKQGATQALTLDPGFNILNFDLPTSEAGIFDYKVVVEPAEADGDTSEFNNEYLFTQNVTSELKVLLVASSDSEHEIAKSLYGEKADIEFHKINKSVPNRNKKVPYEIEDLCKYDEIMISNVDVRLINNSEAFIKNVGQVVSLFGKSLVTIGDGDIQNKTDDILKDYEDMLPVKYGNQDQDKKLLAIVIDASYSVHGLGNFGMTMAKDAAKELVGMLNEGDYVMVASFYGDVQFTQPITELKDKQKVFDKIDSIEPKHGTVIGAGIEQTADEMSKPTWASIENKQMFLISDGKSTGTDTNSVLSSKALAANEKGILLSTLLIARSESDKVSSDEANTMRKIAQNGGGQYFAAATVDEIGEIMLTEVGNHITETIILNNSTVDITRKNDDSVNGVTRLPNINGYVYASTKASANTILVAPYQKSSTVTTDVPIYAYWDYGNGRVSSLTTDLGSDWAKAWVEDEQGIQFLKNILTTNIPEERIDYPFTLNVDYDGTNSYIEIVPAVLDPEARVTVRLTSPEGELITQPLFFDSQKYSHEFETSELGKYDIKISYSSGEKSYDAYSFVNLSYSPEYDSFTVYDESSLHEAIRDRGTVSENGEIVLENDSKEVATYSIYFTIPFLIAAIVLYIIDIIVRKIKWNDIKSLFKRKQKGGTNA